MNEPITDITKFEERSEGEVVEVQPIQESPASMIQTLLRAGATPETLKEMLELQREWERGEAVKIFNEAFAAFKAESIIIYKDKNNAQYKSMYASEDAILNTVNPILSKHGLSLRFKPVDIEKGYGIEAILSHKAGHHEKVIEKGPLDTSGSKNPLQQVKSTKTYLRKMAAEDILGISSRDQGADDDGNAAGASPLVNEKQVSQLVDMLNSTESDEGKFLEFMKVESVESIPANHFNKAMSALQAKARAKK